ncbi:MAG: hypothetical protein ACI4LA_05455, partial [Emergencia sp.]
RCGRMYMEQAPVPEYPKYFFRSVLFEENQQDNGDCGVTGRFARKQSHQTSQNCSQQSSGGKNNE